MLTTYEKRLIICVALYSVISVEFVYGSPKKYQTEEGGFQPSNLRYYESDLSPESNKSRKHDQYTKESDRLERFGYISSFGNTGGGNTPAYGSTGIGSAAPTKIDIGGIALGALIGLGAILILPKLANIFSSNYGYRSLDDESSSITDILNRVDNTLEQHNIDSTSCMQRIICSYMYQAQQRMKNKEASTVDEIIYSLANNSLLTFMLDGSSIKQAIDMGTQSDLANCSSLYMKCPVSKENIMEVIRNLLPS